MKKPWSVTTTLRNPERLMGFLRVIDLLDGSAWDSNTQVKYQTLLIQHREYGNLHDLYSSIIDAVSEISSSTDWLDAVNAKVDCWSARLNK